MSSRGLWRTKTRGPRNESPRNHEESQTHHPGRLTDAVPGRSAALDVCVASSDAAARGDAGQAAFDRKISHTERQIPDLRGQGIVYRPLVLSTDGQPHPAVTRTLQHAAQGIVYRPLVLSTDGQPHPAVTRTLQHAADIATCPHGQQKSA